MSNLISLSAPGAAAERASEVLAITSALVSGFVFLLAVAVAF